MKINCDIWTSRRVKITGGILGIAIALILIGPDAWGQARDKAVEKGENTPDARSDSRPFRTFYLTNATQQQNAANEIVVALRNMLPPEVKIYLLPSQNAIAMRASQDELTLAQQILNDIDRPKKIYRLTFTITNIDGVRRVGTQHYSMIVVTGQRTVLKQGDRVPIVTGSTGSGPDASTQMTYLDVGMNFEATLDESASGVRLNSKVEELNIAEEKSGTASQDPIFRQTRLESASFLTAGKPLILGSLDIPGSTRHVDIDVVMDLVK